MKRIYKRRQYLELKARLKEPRSFLQLVSGHGMQQNHHGRQVLEDLGIPCHYAIADQISNVLCQRIDQ